jgi:kynurenine formamidase
MNSFLCRRWFLIFSVALVWILGPYSLPHACAQESPTLIDLTHPFDKNTIYWPTEPGFKFDVAARGVTEKGYFYAANRFATAEHGGTHIDAPIHFFANRETVDQIPLWRLVGPGVCVDVSDRCTANRDYLISVEDFTAWEQATGQSLSEKIVLLNTGYAQHWPDREKYLGTKEQGKGAIPLLHFPGLDPVAADWLIRQRKVRAVGIDTASIDFGQSTDFKTHIRLCEANVPALENVANLDSLPTHGFTVMTLPMKIAGGSGGPCRIVAMLEK